MASCYSSHDLASAVADKTYNKGRAISEGSVPSGNTWGGSCLPVYAVRWNVSLVNRIYLRGRRHLKDG